MNTISIEELLDLKIFKCKFCQKRCQYPVMIVTNDGNYCRTCINDIKYDHVEENTEINTILEKFQIPCRFNENGCDTIDKIVELTEHEKSCYYRDKICPLYLLNQCKIRNILDIYDHFNEEHRQFIVRSDNDSVTLCFNIKNSLNLDILRLLVIDHENFLLHVKFDEDQNQLLYALFSYGDTDDVKNYTCTIQQANNDVHMITKEFVLQFESDFNAIINVDKAISYDLGVVKRCFDSTDTTIKIIRKHTMSNVKNNDILNTLKCITCKSYLRNEIRQCTTGHSTCKDCIIENKKCSVCNSAFSGTRNYTLEALCGLLKYPCTNRGCSKYFSSKNISKHEADCSLKQFTCPFREMLHCQINGMHKDITQHIISEHGDKSSQNNYFERRLSINNITDEIYCLIAFNTIFCFHFEKDENVYIFSCKYIGIKSLAKRFMFEIGLISHLQRDNKMILKNSWNKNGDDQIWVEIHDHNIRQYVDGSNEILLYYKVKKYYEN